MYHSQPQLALSLSPACRRRCELLDVAAGLPLPTIMGSSPSETISPIKDFIIYLDHVVLS